MSEDAFVQQIVSQVAIGLALQVLFTLALFAWGRWVARRQGGSGLWRAAAWSPWISFGLLMVGLLASIAMLVRAFGSTAATDPSRRASELAEGISSAMNVAALFVFPGYAILLAGLVVFVVGSFRRPAAKVPSR